MKNTPFRMALILGGARSGKSRYAEALVQSVARRTPIYIATAEARDDEMQARIAQHRAQRGDGWHTIEEPLALPARLQQNESGDVVLVDCLTLWLSNLILADHDIEDAAARLCAALAASPAQIVLVANEVGLGIVPENALARRFRDEAGRLNQRVAALADHVAFIAAGLPLLLKGR
jgi:adenosylcobinamide kinase/adenosylcobinamide-phosphate guanylyltransferase